MTLWAPSHVTAQATGQLVLPFNQSRHPRRQTPRTGGREHRFDCRPTQSGWAASKFGHQRPGGAVKEPEELTGGEVIWKHSLRRVGGSDQFSAGAVVAMTGHKRQLRFDHRTSSEDRPRTSALLFSRRKHHTLRRRSIFQPPF